MSDAIYAKSIIEELWPPRVYSRKSIITKAFEAIERFERSLPKAVVQERGRQWTERRVRSIVDDEAPRLERYEVADLERMAVKEGFNAYNRSVERAARLAQFLAHCDEDFYRADIDAQVVLARAYLGTGDRLAVPGTNEAGASADRTGQRVGGLSRARTGDDFDPSDFSD